MYTYLSLSIYIYTHSMCYVIVLIWHNVVFIPQDPGRSRVE